MRKLPALREERGSVTVLTVAVMFFAAILALVTVDVLRALESKARAQTAADAAALAAAQEMALSPGNPTAAASDFAGRNGGVLVECRCDPSGSAAVVRVKVPVEPVFLRTNRDVSASARAVVEPLSAPG